VASATILLQGIVFSKYVELDFDEVVCRKTLAVSTKEQLRSVAESGNPLEVEKKLGTLCSGEYCVLSADLRNLDQVGNRLEVSCDPGPVLCAYKRFSFHAG
jgi:hypothetical protein